MQPHNPSRRRLFGGLVAGLFGWLLPRKTPAQTPPTAAAPGGFSHSEVKQGVCTSTCQTYTAEGYHVASSPPLLQHGTSTTTYVYDSQHRLLSITFTNSFPPPPKGPRHG